MVGNFLLMGISFYADCQVLFQCTNDNREQSYMIDSGLYHIYGLPNKRIFSGGNLSAAQLNKQNEIDLLNGFLPRTA